MSVQNIIVNNTPSIIQVVETIGFMSTIEASNVTLLDSGGYYTSENAEGALQEVGADLAGKFDTAGTNLDSSGTTVSLEAEIDTTQYDSTYQTLTYSANVAWDMSSGQAAKVTLTGGAEIDNPTNKNSIAPILEVTQDGTGGHALTFGTDFVEVNIDNVTTDASSVTVYVFVKDSAGNFRGRGQTYSV